MGDRTMSDRVLATLHGAVFDDTLWPACSALIDEVCQIKGNMLSIARGQSQDEAALNAIGHQLEVRARIEPTDRSGNRSAASGQA